MTALEDQVFGECEKERLFQELATDAIRRFFGVGERPYD